MDYNLWQFKLKTLQDVPGKWSSSEQLEIQWTADRNLLVRWGSTFQWLQLSDVHGGSFQTAIVVSQRVNHAYSWETWGHQWNIHWWYKNWWQDHGIHPPIGWDGARGCDSKYSDDCIFFNDPFGRCSRVWCIACHWTSRLWFLKDASTPNGPEMSWIHIPHHFPSGLASMREVGISIKHE